MGRCTPAPSSLPTTEIPPVGQKGQITPPSCLALGSSPCAALVSPLVLRDGGFSCTRDPVGQDTAQTNSSDTHGLCR